MLCFSSLGTGNMAEVEYQHECNRAELLGLPKPDRGEFFSRQTPTASEGNEKEVSGDEVERPQGTEQSTGQDEGVRREGFQRIGGGLEELNTILSSTQRKLNRLKTACASFGNLVKVKMGGRKEGNGEGRVDVEGQDSGSFTAQAKSCGNVDLDKLDFLISRAERAELSLSSQNKQIKKFLN